MMYARLGVTVYLHFWQNDRNLLRASAVLERTQNKSQHIKLIDFGEENSPAASAGIRTRNFSITSPALYAIYALRYLHSTLYAIPAPR